MTLIIYKRRVELRLRHLILGKDIGLIRPQGYGVAGSGDGGDAICKMIVVKYLRHYIWLDVLPRNGGLTSDRSKDGCHEGKDDENMFH